MTRTIVIICFLVAFAAGLTVGIESYQAVAPSLDGPKRCESGLAADLGLSAEQQEQLKKIWSETGRGGGRGWEERRQIYRERDEAIAALIRPEDQPRYDEIMKKHAEQTAALEGEWRRSFETKVERTKQILTPEQRVKYEKMLERRHWERGGREHHQGDREHEPGRQRGRTGTSPGTS